MAACGEMIPVTLSATDPVINQGAATISPDGQVSLFLPMEKRKWKNNFVNLLFRKTRRTLEFAYPPSCS